MICNLASGKGKFPLPIIYESKNWIINQAYPSQIKGWLVLSVKKHRKAFHEITEAEATELSELLPKVAKVLKETTKCKKEYILSSNEGLEHFHFHIVPRARNLKSEWFGPKIYKAIRIEEKDSIPKRELKLFSKKLKKLLSN